MKASTFKKPDLNIQYKNMASKTRSSITELQKQRSQPKIKTQTQGWRCNRWGWRRRVADAMCFDEDDHVLRKSKPESHFSNVSSKSSLLLVEMKRRLVKSRIWLRKLGLDYQTSDIRSVCGARFVSSRLQRLNWLVEEKDAKARR